MIRRSQKPLRKRRKVIKVSQHWANVGNEYRLFPDGRRVAFNTPRGQAWYRKQTILMANRQCWVCGICQDRRRLMNYWSPEGATFQHGDGRGMGGARRNDDIDAPGNCASHWDCNSEAGSRRLS
jgi:hypothetical protein